MKQQINKQGSELPEAQTSKDVSDFWQEGQLLDQESTSCWKVGVLPEHAEQLNVSLQCNETRLHKTI